MCKTLCWQNDNKQGMEIKSITLMKTLKRMWKKERNLFCHKVKNFLISSTYIRTKNVYNFPVIYSYINCQFNCSSNSRKWFCKLVRNFSCKRWNSFRLVLRDIFLFKQNKECYIRQFLHWICIIKNFCLN